MCFGSAKTKKKKLYLNIAFGRDRQLYDRPSLHLSITYRYADYFTILKKLKNKNTNIFNLNGRFPPLTDLPLMFSFNFHFSFYKQSFGKKKSYNMNTLEFLMHLKVFFSHLKSFFGHGTGSDLIVVRT